MDSMTETLTICKPLKWDSEFFQLKIASVRCIPPFNVQALATLFEELKREGYDLVYLFAEGEPVPLSSLPGTCACELVDMKYTYRTDDLAAPEPAPEVYSYDGPPQELFSLAFQAGSHSRYRTDKNFAAGTFERFYRTWIVNSVNRQIADYVYVYPNGSAPGGFITLKIDDEIATIGLIATDPALRGRGIGTKLVGACKRTAALRGARTISVATQAANVDACAF